MMSEKISVKSLVKLQKILKCYKKNKKSLKCVQQSSQQSSQQPTLQSSQQPTHQPLIQPSTITPRGWTQARNPIFTNSSNIDTDNQRIFNRLLNQEIETNKPLQPIQPLQLGLPKKQNLMKTG